MSQLGLTTEAMIGVGMLLLGVPYVFRDKLKAIRPAVPALLRSRRALKPHDVLDLIERTECAAARNHLVAALNCLLESSDAPDA